MKEERKGRWEGGMEGQRGKKASFRNLTRCLVLEGKIEWFYFVL